MNELFKKAVKYEAKLRLAIAGPSGSGKTYTSLAVGTALAGDGKVAVVDTEHGSASKYADLFEFDVMEMRQPFHPQRFVEAIKAAADAGYKVVILDSLSHAWNGPGGLLEIVDQVSKKYRGNTYAGWGEGTPIQNRLIEAIVGADLHIISAMRSKQEYILIEKNGKQVPQKVGMAPVQRDSFEYEFDIYLDMDMENNAIVQKTRCPVITGQVYAKPGVEFAGIVGEWLTGSEAPKPAPKAKPTGNGRNETSPDKQDARHQPTAESVKAPANGTEPDDNVMTLKDDGKKRKRFHAMGTETYGPDWPEKRKQLYTHFGVQSSNDLTIEQTDTLMAGFDRRLEGTNGDS